MPVQKKKLSDIFKPEQPAPGEFFNEVLSTQDGDLIVSVNLATVMNDLQRYQQALLSVRGVPLDIENVSPRDVRIAIVAKMPWLKTVKEQRDRLRSFYEVEHSKAQRDASLLLLFSSQNNVFTVDPKPYEVESVLPGLENDIPAIRPNLNIPLERRLKQIMDVLANGDTYGKAMGIISRVSEAVDALGMEDEETDQNKFHPTTTG